MALIPRGRQQLLLLALELHQHQQQVNFALLALLRRHQQREERRRRRRFWVRPWISRRARFGNYENLMMELERESRGDFVNFLRMEPRMFRELLDRLTPRLRRQDTNFRRPLEPGIKLAIALRYFATGDSYHSLQYSFRVPHNTISLVVKEVAEAIIAEYEGEVFQIPSTPERWMEVSYHLYNL